MASSVYVNDLADKDSKIVTDDHSQRETLTIEEAVDRVVDKVTVKLALTLVAISLVIMPAPSGTYITVFTGYIPYTQWECTSKKCLRLLNEAESTDDFYTQKTMCKNDLVAGSDFVWTYEKQTFSMDWGFYCKDEAKLSLVTSVLFIGTFLGLVCSTAIFDRIGRKRGSMMGSFLSLATFAISSAATNYIVLLFLRIIYGFGLIIVYTGAYCWIVELAPQRLRNMTSNMCTLAGWTTGVLALIGLNYVIDKWQYVYLASAGMNALTIILFFVLPVPVSPRFSLIKGKKDEAFNTLKVLAKMSDNEVSLDKVDLVYEERNQSYLEQIKDFRQHPNMRRETLLGMSVWFMVALFFYSYQFGWSKMGTELHSIYFFAAVGEAISFIIAVPLCKVLGRRKSLIFSFMSVVVMNAVASLDVKFTDDWSLEHLASMLGSIGAGTAFVLMYLYTGELAPTSHRGMILCLSSSCARIGSFVGPYVNLLYGVTDRRVPLALFAGLSFLASVVVWFLPDTTGRPVPETPGDVEILAKTENKGKDSNSTMDNKA